MPLKRFANPALQDTQDKEVCAKTTHFETISQMKVLIQMWNNLRVSKA